MKRLDFEVGDPGQRERRLVDALSRSIQPPHLPVVITHMLNFGRTWTVKLSCGCARKGLTSENLKSEQLYIGKAVKCDRHP